MIADLKPYAEYKESGLPWLGKVPKGWDVKRAKSIFQRIDERSTTGKEELLTVSSARGIVPRKTANVTMFKAESYLGYKLCWPGDLVINSLWAWAGGLGVSRYHGIISSAYGVYRIRSDAPMTPAFVHEVVRSSSFSWELRVRSKGVWISRLQLTDISFLDAPMHIPPPDEQAAIVRFLDWANGRLERAIRAKRSVIALLNEQKQAIIHLAVTRGFDPSVPLKTSGIPWLGEIPQHWEVTKLKHISPQITVGIVVQPARLYVSRGVPALRSLNISSGSITTEDLVHISEEGHLANRKSQLREGDIVAVRTGRTGVAVIVPTEFDGANCVDLLILRKSRRLLSNYLLMYLRSYGAKEDIKFNSVGAIQAHYNTGTLANLRIPLPSLVEQRQILTSTDDQLAPINAAISRLEREVELLREYRTRLVADLVTGKLDVREAAARLPVEAAADIGEDAADANIDPETGEEQAA
jgi:type I restriction enzyme, S subunit